MNRKFWHIVFVALWTLLFSGLIIAVAQAGTVGDRPRLARSETGQSWLEAGSVAARLQATYNTTITVESTLDEGGMSEKCSTPGKDCTLRRAINEARSLSSGSLPVLIAFDIPTTDPGYDSDHQVWVIELDSTQTSDNYIFRDFNNGQITVNGATQPPGRPLSEGPRIILRGDNKEGVFNVKGGDNAIRGLAFQGFGGNVINVSGNDGNNLIEDNWFGLTITGTEIYLRDPDAHPEDGSGETSIYVQSGSVSNTVQNNVLVGFKAGAINVQSDDSFILSNTIGTRADGTVPEVREDRKCKPNARYYNWFAGAGVNVSGNNNLVVNNRIVGMLFQSADPLNTPDDALEVTGHDHIVRNNVIGVTSDGQPFGVCGEGIHVGGASGGHYVQVLTNTIVGSRGAAGILVTGGEHGYDLDAVTVRGNIIEESTNEAFAFGDILPATLRDFNPAAVTSISGLDVSGTNGDGSPCAGCIVELFLDEVDTVTETLESLAVTTADASGNWNVTLARTLALTEGIRTASTTSADGQIPNPSEPGYVYHAGTTTKISAIYTQTGAPAPTPPPEPTPFPPLPIPEPTYAPKPTAPTTYITIITVNSASDPDDSKSYSCNGVPTKPARTPCTLRRALVEADALMDDDPSTRPILIRFDIPTTDPQYDASLGAWVIQITDTADSLLPTLGSTDIEKSGQVVIDGASQPDHDGIRPDSPRIIIRGHENDNLDALVINGNGNVVRGLAFQNFRDGLQINHSGNIVEDNWFGLTITGTEIYLRTPGHPEDGSGASGIVAAAASDNNLIQHNVFAGLDATAINLGGGSDNYVVSNYIGTRADGTVPDVPTNRRCHPNARYYNWFGGAGIKVSAPGIRNQIGGPNPEDGNLIAGLLFWSADPESTPHNALDVSGGRDHLIQHNVIGVDTAGKEVGVCGRGIVVGSKFTRIFSNTVVASGMEALRSAGDDVDTNARTFRGNVAKDVAELLEYGDYIPPALSIFTPTQITTIDGTTVSGINGHENAPCPYCRVELFLDDLDGVTETLQTMEVITADVNGDWTATLSRTLALTEGLRTAITTLNYGVIENFEAGTTSRFSQVYSQTGAILIPPPPDPIPEPPLPIPEPDYAPAPEPPTSYNTVITVTTTADSGTPPSGSLRWAINQVEALTEIQRPALIAFDIPTTDSGYDAAGFWKITLASTALPPVKGGQVTIDGATQLGGRSDGPKIILFRNSSTGADLQLGETQYDGSYVVQGLAFQGVEVSMTGSGNIVQNNWLGLSDDGTAIYLYNDDPYYENHALINGSSAGDNNLIRNNRLAGSRTNAINLQSDDNLIEGNYIGTRADGTIDVASVDPSNICDQTEKTDNWFGGGGIYLVGTRNRVISNTLVGLLTYGSSTTTPPDAIELTSGQDNLIQNNRIGRDATGADVWTCGSGLDIGASFTRILSNTIASSFKEGIFVNGTTIAINGNMMRGNVISNCVAAIEFGDAVPDELALFSPALATVISDTNVTGMSDDDCPYCWVDVYLDDDDSYIDAQAYLGSTTADVDGNWSFILPAPLDEGQGLRTISTARDYGVVEDFEAGTSSKLSSLFKPQPPTPPDSVEITGPTGDLLIGEEYSFIATVSPVSTTLPITYVWQATDQAMVVNTGGLDNDVSFSWDDPGVKAITVTASNAHGSQMDTLTVHVAQQIVETFEPGVGGSIDFTDPQGLTTTIQVPGDALSETTTFTYTEVTAPTQEPGSLLFAGRAFDLDGSAALAGAITISLSYSDEDLAAAGIAPEDESSLLLYYWAGTEWEDVASTCEPTPSEYHRDEEHNVLGVAVCHLTPFGLFGGEPGWKIYLPVVMRNSS